MRPNEQQHAATHCLPAFRLHIIISVRSSCECEAEQTAAVVTESSLVAKQRADELAGLNSGEYRVLFFRDERSGGNHTVGEWRWMTN